MSFEGFKLSGVGSPVWYLQTIKENSSRYGYTYLRELKHAPNAARMKENIDFLVNARYLDRSGMPPRTIKYTVTSFGHRYLVDNADQTSEPSKLPSKLLGHSQKIQDHEVFHHHLVPAEEHVFELPAVTPTAVEGDEIRTATDEEQEIINAQKNIEVDAMQIPSDFLTARPVHTVAEDLDDDGDNDEQIMPETDVDTVDYLKRMTGEILYERSAFTVSAKDLIEYIGRKK